MVVGLMFDPAFQRLVMIRKADDSKIEAIRGLLNPPGGKIEDGEHPHDAMVREFREETGVEEFEWEHFLNLRVDHGPDERFIIYFYRCDSFQIEDVKTMETEPVGVYNIDQLIQGLHPMVPNLKWIIPLAKYPKLLKVVEVAVD